MSADAAALIAALTASGSTIACAESLTGGALVSSLVDVPGASAVVRGGVVSYATDVKASVLGVSKERLATHGPVDARVALQMAAGARRVLGHGGVPADIGVATTGVAGPEPQGGRAVGTVYIAVSADAVDVVREYLFAGDRAAIRAAAVAAAIALVRESVADRGDGSKAAT
ncbi:nicotinamide-nucleotide amidohydrolase family protein [Microbacteriaceae bacterium VKM Ac-2855]|nr:nicotinamide-nucleotide amidohydrolase family protein [Microbacteriaceae bacterium VKM Ac-2855]